MPEDMGEFHVWDNIPEYHDARRQERPGDPSGAHHRRQAGDADAAVLRRHALCRVPPDWGVPDSIKVKELLPYLRPSAERLLRLLRRHRHARAARHNLNVSSMAGRRSDAGQLAAGRHPPLPVHPAARRHQRAGRGQVPLPQQARRLHARHPAARAVRASRCAPSATAACASRIRAGWPRSCSRRTRAGPAAQVRRLLAQGGNNEVELTKQIPVHVTYFTAWWPRTASSELSPTSTATTPRGGGPWRAAAAAGTAVGRYAATSRAFKKVKQAGDQPQSNDFFSGLFGN